jgi:hypothetical protein
VRCLESRRLCGWAFDQYLAIAPPAFVADGPRALTRSRLTALSANVPASA